MKQTLSKDMFRFQMNQIRPENFSYEGQGVLFDYFEEIDSEIEFDPIAICCDFSECSIKEFAQAYSMSDMEIFFDTRDEEARAEISKHIEKNGFWYQFLNDGKDIIFENF